MSNSEITPSPKQFKIWQKVLVAFIFLAVLAQLFGTNTDPSTTSSLSGTSSSSSSTELYDDSWIPTDFSGYPEDDNVAWRWAKRSETKCTYSSCWAVMVITRDGCTSGIYAEISIFDKAGVQIDFTNDSTSRVSPKTQVKLTFETFNDEADTAQIGKISCR